MIERLIWRRDRPSSGLESPFMRGEGERPLRITFHSSGLADMCGEDSAALDALRELSHVEEVEANEQATIGAKVLQRQGAEEGWLTV